MANSGCCYKEVYRFTHIAYLYSTCISSFFAAASPFLCSFFDIKLPNSLNRLEKYILYLIKICLKNCLASLS